MATSSLLTGGTNNNNTATYLGRIVCWSLPEGMTRSHADVVAALTTAGLDPTAAKALCKRHAFVRAMRKLAKRKLIRVIFEDRDLIRFQLNDVCHKGNTLVEYPLECTLELEKATGVITCPDAAMLATAQAELNASLDCRRNADITRLINQLFSKHADLFSIKGGCYFVPEQHSAFCDKVETFVGLMGGSMLQYPIPDGTQIGNTSVSVVIADSMSADITEYENAIESLSYDSSRRQFESAYSVLASAERRVHEYQNYLAAHAARLEDHIAYCRSRIEAKLSEVIASV